MKNGPTFCKLLRTGALALMLLDVAATWAQNFAPYMWEFPLSKNIQLPPDRNWMLEDLRIEVNKILAAGHLAPYYFNSGDLAHEGYFLYVSPGRIITTLAWAYPHITPAKLGLLRKNGQ